MKKIITLILAIMMVITLASCGKEPEKLYELAFEPNDDHVIVTINEEASVCKWQYSTPVDTSKFHINISYSGITMDDVERLVNDYVN